MMDHPPTTAQVQACLPDAMRLCSNVPFDLESIRACLLKQQKQLSDSCKKAMKE